MCGRYYFSLDKGKNASTLKQLLEQYELLQFEQGEIFPAQDVLALVLDNEQCLPKVKKWGIKTSRALIINARSETVHEKKMFQKMQRCVVPCNKFYEWKSQGKHKTQYEMKVEHDDIMYLAALCSEQELVILTKEAQGAMRKIHHRSPILLRQKEIQHYLNHYDDNNKMIEDDQLFMEVVGASEQITFMLE